MIEQFYPQIRMLHIGCVVLSGSLFAVRGMLRIGESSAANHRALRVASYAIDSTLLVAAILLTKIVHQYPIANNWLTAKVLLLFFYIGLGTVALKRGRTRGIRVTAFAAALLTFICMIGVAVSHDPAGWLARIRR